MKSFLKILSVFALTALIFSGCRNDDFYLQNTPQLSVSAASFDVDASVHVLTIDVESTRRWIIRPVSATDDWFSITPIWSMDEDNNILLLGGEDNGRITVTISANVDGPRRLVLNVETAGGLSRQVDIFQRGRWDETDILAENFGTGATQTFGAAGNSWPLLSQWTFSPTGASAATVRYASSGGTVDVRSNAVSVGYRDASGGNNVMFSAGSGGNFYIHGIGIDDYQTLLLSFGANQPHDTISVHFRTYRTLPTNGIETSEWSRVPFEKIEAGWSLVETMFYIPENVDSLSLRISARPVSFGARIDDITLRGTAHIIPILVVQPRILSFNEEASYQEIDIFSNVEWTITSSESWVTVTESGDGSATVSVYVEENTTDERRSATLTISGAGVEGGNRTVVIEQSGQ